MYIFPNFYPFLLYPLYIHLIIHFYVRCGGLGYIHTWFQLFLFQIIRSCVSVHFLGPLIQSSISFRHCLLSVCIIVLVSVPNFYSFIFPYVILVRSSHHAGLCHIALGVSLFLCRFYVHMVLVILPDWVYSFKFIPCFIVVFHLTLHCFTYIGAHHICICGEIYSLIMLS